MGRLVVEPSMSGRFSGPALILAAVLVCAFCVAGAAVSLPLGILWRLG